jgi:hypothetical protein
LDIQDRAFYDDIYIYIIIDRSCAHENDQKKTP